MKLNKLFLSCILLLLVVGCKNHKATEAEYIPPAPSQVEPQAVAVAPEPEVQEPPTVYRISSSTGNWVTDSDIKIEDGCAKFTVNEKLVYTCGNYSIQE